MHLCYNKSDEINQFHYSKECRKMNEQEHKILSIAALSASLAWSLLTPEQQRQALEYLEKVREKERTNEKTQEICTTR